MSQQGVYFSKKISKMEIFFDLTLTEMFTLGTMSENKVVQILKFSKNDNNKIPSKRRYFFNE